MDDDPPPKLPTSIQSLPNELLLQIISYFDCEPPSISKFSHEPSSALTVSDYTPLKSLSLVSRRWRSLALSTLFRYTRIDLNEEPRWVPINARLIESMQGHLSKLSDHEMHIYQKMRNIQKSSAMFAFDEMFDDLLVSYCCVQKDDEFLKSAPLIHWLPSLSKTFPTFSRFVEQYGLKRHIESVIVHTAMEYELRHVSTSDAPLRKAVSDIWSQLLSCLEPTRVVVAAPPSTMACLLDTTMLSPDAWAFDMRMHYIELIQPDPRHNPPHPRSPDCRPWDTALIHQRPWSHLSYNEGSSISAYSTYEYHLKQAPKILYLLLCQLSHVSPCCNINSFTFTSVFPYNTSISAIIFVLRKIPTLKKIEVRLAPGPENNVLASPKRMRRAQPHDLWLEWTESYNCVETLLCLYEFGDGAEFTSRDCEQLSLAEEVEDMMQKVRERGIGWRKVERGTWVRDRALDKPLEEALEVMGQ